MKFVYILENDERIQKDLFDTLKSLDPNLIIRFFYKLDDFHDWLKLALREGRSALNIGGNSLKIDTGSTTSSGKGDDELSLFISCSDMLGVKNLSLLKRAKVYFLSQRICAEDNPTNFLLTTFHDLDLSNQPADELIISNIVYKPFDMLILKQHLEFALNGRKPLTSSTIAPLKINESIEMLKGLKVSSMSEIGFQSKSRTEMKVGAVNKYYGDFFAADSKRSVFAYCKSSTAVSAKEFVSEFEYFGAENKQMSQVRRSIFADKKHVPKEVKNINPQEVNILILDSDNKMALDFRTVLIQKITNAKILIYNVQNQLLSDIADKDTPQRKTLPSTFDLIVFNYKQIQGDKERIWAEFCNALWMRASTHHVFNFLPPPVIMYSNQSISDQEMRGLGRWVKDIFYAPYDTSYVHKKLLSLFPKMANKEAVSLGNLDGDYSVKIANPVEITEISEAGLILRYNMALPIGNFGEFYLLRESEPKAPEITGVVSYTEPEKDNNGSFLNHFVLFGMKDIYLKHIRLWLREAYVRAKNAKS